MEQRGEDIFAAEYPDGRRQRDVRAVWHPRRPFALAGQDERDADRRADDGTGHQRKERARPADKRADGRHEFHVA